nr:unnamed protein product [Digitaria exilis]
MRRIFCAVCCRTSGPAIPLRLKPPSTVARRDDVQHSDSAVEQRHYGRPPWAL